MSLRSELVRNDHTIESNSGHIFFIIVCNWKLLTAIRIHY